MLLVSKIDFLWQ